MALAAVRRSGTLTALDLPPTGHHMIMDDRCRTLRFHARSAGALYLVNVVTGLFGLAYVPSRISGAGDAARTVHNIVAYQDLFRTGIAAELICCVSFLLLPLALYRLFGTSHRVLATLMVVLAIASVPISFGALAHRLDVLALFGQAPWLHALTAEQLQTQVMLQLSAYQDGQLMAQVFWGLWLIPFGLLVVRSRQLPRLLGSLLVMGGLGYVIDALGQILLPDYRNHPFADFVTLPAALGEIGTCLWLIWMGARPERD